MLKKISTIAGILIVLGIATYSLLNKSSEDGTVLADKGKQELLDTVEEEQIVKAIKTVTEKLQTKYQSFGVSANSNNEVVIQVRGDKDYFNSASKDIESIAKNVIRSSPLKEFKVVVQRVEFPEEDRSRHKELFSLLSALGEGLKSYDVIEDINAEYQKAIIIHTSVKNSDKEAYKSALEIEDTVNQILNSNRFNVGSYKIEILNADGKLVN